mgnify:CR=1 FL=1
MDDLAIPKSSKGSFHHTGRPCASAKGLQHLVQLRQHLLTRLDGAGTHELAEPIHHPLQVTALYHLRGRHLGHVLEPFALQAECTHLGCLVGPWNPLSQRFVCPCHGSEYKRDGSVARGPAPKPLKLAKVGTDEQGQVVLEKWTEQDFRENV